MENLQLTDRQRREVEFFADRKRLTEVDFNYYDTKRYGPWNPRWTAHNYIREQFKDPSQRLLEYGCGRGQRSIMYARIGYDVHGFDLAPNQIENSRELAETYDLSNRTHFSVLAAEKLDYPDDFFDVVAGNNILHHVDLEQAMPELRRVLKPGGTAVFADSLATPRRDALRRSSLVTWLVPMTGDATDDEHPLTQSEIAIIREAFPKLDIQKFRVLAVFAKALGVAVSRKKKRMLAAPLERVDAALFHILPWIRRFGDEVVLIVRK